MIRNGESLESPTSTSSSSSIVRSSLPLNTAAAKSIAINAQTSSCPKYFAAMNSASAPSCSATAALASSSSLHPISPRIPPALQALYAQANSDQPLTVPAELVAKGLLAPPYCKGALPLHKRRPCNKHKQQSQSLLQGQLKKSLPRVVTMTAADAASASIKTRQLQVALEDCSMNETFPAAAVAKSAAATTPLDYLNSILTERGYSTKSYSTLQTGFVNTPTDLQQASYHMYMISLVRKNDIAAFKQVMLSGLVAPNPCNQFGESILHMVCRRGRYEMLHIMLQAGASIHVVDDFGRTPLVDACWSSETAFDVVRVLLDLDARLVSMCDLRGASPLSYIPKKDYASWIRFLDSVKDTYWPHRGVSPQPQGPPPITLEAPRSRPTLQPRVAGVTCQVASLVASGQMSPEQAMVVVTGSSSCSFQGSSSEGSSKQESSEASAMESDDDEDDYSDSWSDDDDDASLSSIEIQQIRSDVEQRLMSHRL